MNRNGSGGQVGGARRLVTLASFVVMAGVIGVIVVAAIWPNADATDPADDSDFNTEASASPSPSVDAGSNGVTSTPVDPSLVARPNPKMTPGDSLPATPAQICAPGYSKNVRNLRTAEKNTVYASYGVKTHAPGQYEVDRLISLELGGSNDTKNLWPEPAEPRPGFHEKDTLENTLHQLVCDGTVPLAEAQQAIAKDWYAAYLHYVLGK